VPAAALLGCATVTAVGSVAKVRVVAPVLAGKDEALTNGAANVALLAAVSLPIAEAANVLLSAPGGWMYQGSSPIPPPEVFVGAALKGLGVAVMMLMVLKSMKPRSLRKPELVPMESALRMAEPNLGSMSAQYTSHG
jgi:hypothetical protein